MRKLVTIRTVSDIQPIPGADRIEVVTVDGWEIVTKKNEFKIGDRGVYFEIDSFLPIEERYEFLRPYSYKKYADGMEGFRLRTVKLRKQISQGLLLPLTLFTEIDINNYIEGTDLSELLNVVKFERPIAACLSGLTKGNFPYFIPKTDQERIQNLPMWIDKYSLEEFEITEKEDGTSATYYFHNGEFGVCSRNLELKETENNVYWQMAKEWNIEDYLRSLNRNIAIQGEIVGPGIQGNPLGISKIELHVFDIFDIDLQRYLSPDERCEVLYKFIDLQHIPILAYEKILKNNDMKTLLNYARGPCFYNSSRQREGVVCKSMNLINGQGIFFKIINNDYLLKEK